MGRNIRVLLGQRGLGFGREREQRLLWGKPALPGGMWNEACSALTQPPARGHQSGWRSCQPRPADGHVHVLGPCPGWTALLTGCGLWSPMAGSGGSSVLIWPELDYLGRLPARPPLWPEYTRAVLLQHSALSWASGRPGTPGP